MYVVLDYETRSKADLKKVGAWRYSEDPTTIVLCLSWCIGEGAISTWYPGQPIPEALAAAIADPTFIFVAHNSQFEIAHWTNHQTKVYGWPDLPIERWACTMSRCAQLVIHSALERVVPLLKLPGNKDMEGNKITLALSKPDKVTGELPPIGPTTLARVGAYCEQDVEEQRHLLKRVGWLSDGERKVWMLDQTINRRGVQLDMPLIRSMRKIVDDASGPLKEEFAALTGGLSITQGEKIKGWVMDRGILLPDMTKDTLELLVGDDEEAEHLDIDLPPDVERALGIRYLIGSASIKKLDAMERCVCRDGRARGLLAYYGAGTGRWAGRLLQPQNFPRGSITMDSIDQMVDALLTGDWQYVEMICGPAVETVVSSLRHAIIASRGNVLVAGDFAQIEARVVLALAGQHDKVALLASGASPYIDMGRQIYGREIDKHKDIEEYTISKNSVLGLGFQMGDATFMRRYGNGQDQAFFKEVVRVYRQEWAPEVPKLWRGLEEAACRTVWDRTPHEAYGIRFELVDQWLKVTLPSGGTLWYFNPRPSRKAMPWDATDIRPAWTYQAKKAGKWPTIDAYGGLITENVVQRLARDLLVAAMFRLEKENLPICLTVHDEAVSEARFTNDLETRVNQIMSDTPAWGRELRIPVATEVWSGSRYKK